jgi:hypothetical protein
LPGFCADIRVGLETIYKRAGNAAGNTFMSRTASNQETPKILNSVFPRGFIGSFSKNINFFFLPLILARGALQSPNIST